MTSTNTTNSIRSDLLIIRDKVAEFLMTEREIDIDNCSHMKVSENMINACMRIDDAIDALNIVIAKKE